MKHLVLAVLLSGCGLSGCGSVVHTTRPDVPATPRDPTLVEVRTTGYDGTYRIVSHSTWDVDPNLELPATAPTDVVSEMRAEAARRGAEMLLLERFDDAFRKVWLGRGIVRTEVGDTAIVACAHEGFERALARAKDRAQTCIARLAYDRPSIRGEVEVVFEVDAIGRALGVAALPSSSRDGGLQQCVIEAVHATDFGTPVGFSCKGQVGAAVPPPARPL